jgi:hypothetical protein
VTESGRPTGFKSIIGELLAVGAVEPPIAIGTPIGFKLIIGEPVWLAAGPVPPVEDG